MTTLNTHASALVAALTAAQHYNSQQAIAEKDAEFFHVVGAGRTISQVYEQVRNAAEYTEDHLLFQRAIRRFYTRLFLTSDNESMQNTGEELVTELTLAGYVPNDSIPLEKVTTASRVAYQYFTAYQSLSSVGMTKQRAWTIDVLAIELNALLRSHHQRDAFEQFVFQQYRQSITPERIRGDANDFEPLLFAAIHRAIFKSDDATIRWGLLRRFGRSPSDINGFEETNRYIDRILQMKQLETLRRMVSREGAPFRILARMVEENNPALQELDQPQKFIPAFETAVNNAYETAEERINRGVIRSIIFLLITKALIGVAIEIPYDLLVHGTIIWSVLAINLLIPPLYMMVLRITLQLPGPANTRSLVTKIEKILYDETPMKYAPARGAAQYGVVFNTIYTLLILAIFGAAGYGLYLLGFEAVHLLIFFIFFSTASFLGFRLSRTIRELETVESGQNGVAMVRDFVYLPFVVVGRKLSESYAKFNIIATMLDMGIELPLKTVLRVVRRWGAFISSKKDEL